MADREKGGSRSQSHRHRLAAFCVSQVPLSVGAQKSISPCRHQGQGTSPEGVAVVDVASMDCAASMLPMLFMERMTLLGYLWGI